MPPAYEILLLNTAVPQIQAAQAGDTYVVPRDIAFSAALTLSAGTANGVPYLNASKVLTTGSALTFDGTRQTIGSATSQNTLFKQIIGSGGANEGLVVVTGATGKGWLGFNNANSSDIPGQVTYDFSSGTLGLFANGGPIVFSASGSEQMRLTSTGLGIGTSSPATKLQVNTASGDSKIRISSGANTLTFGWDDPNGFIYAAVGGYQAWQIGGTTRMLLDSSGNLGIGTSSPTTKLDVLGSGDSDVRIRAGSDAALIFSETTANKNWKLKPSSGDFYWLYSASAYNSGYSALMALTASGNLKIAGTATRATTEGTNHLDIFNGTAPVGTLSNGISIYSSSGEAYVMDAAGNATLFSPHDAETNEWIFRSKHTPTGKVLKIDVERLLKFVNDHFGLDAVHEFIEE